MDVVEAFQHGERHQHHDSDDAHRNAEDLGDVIHLLLQRSFLIFGGGEHVGDLATCVFIPVPVTIARPVPCVTEVPLKIMLARSPSALASVSVSGFLQPARIRRSVKPRRCAGWPR